jgi:hypothetical protein
MQALTTVPQGNGIGKSISLVRLFQNFSFGTAASIYGFTVDAAVL